MRGVGKRHCILAAAFCCAAIFFYWINNTPVYAGGGSASLTICHIPPGDPSNAHTIAIGAAAWKAHQKHGDSLGACPEVQDADGDGFVSPDDCNDNDASIHPGATEFADSIDQNCDETTFEISLDAASLCFVGEAQDDLAGLSVARVGDVNGDGIDDVAVSAMGADSSGRVYLIYGPLPDSGEMSLALADAVMVGSPGDWALHITSLDFNHDGVNDLAIGAPNANGSAGLVTVFFGGSGMSALSGSYDLTDADLILTGTASDAAGFAITNTGDVNRDGIEDLLIASPGGAESTAFLIFGNASLSGTVSLATVGLSTQGAAFAAESSSETVTTLAGGDLNGDGFADAILGSSAAANGDGIVWVFYGGEASSRFGELSGNFALADADAILLGTNGAGFALAASDVTGDGFDDLIVGTDYGATAYLLFGDAAVNPTAGPIDMTVAADVVFTDDVGDGIFGVNANGDLDRDGFSDILVTTFLATTNQAQTAFFFGDEASQWAETVNLSESDFVFNGADIDPTLVTDIPLNALAGFAGDFDDAFQDDLIFGSFASDVADAGTNAGKACLVLSGFTAAQIGTQSPFYADSDGDGFGDAGESITAYFIPDGYVANATDCQDNNLNISPGADEKCDGLDNNCDGLIDDASSFDAQTYYQDADGDGFGNGEASLTACVPPEGYATVPGDCVDSDLSIHPGATEICDGLDNDCNAATDENLPTSSFYPDTDGDGYGDGVAIEACRAPQGYAATDGDCVDSDLSIHPQASEICDGLDNDCNGGVDTDAVDASLWHEDTDADGFGNPLVAQSACLSPDGFVADASDCDDFQPDDHLLAPEICDGRDNNCDLQIDEAGGDGSVLWFEDLDGDGFGNDSVIVATCAAPEGFVSVGGDCRDVDNTVHPGAAEICGDGLDNDCVGGELACSEAVRDGDGDSFGVLDGDCDDANPLVFPGAMEILDDVDNDCDGLANLIAMGAATENYVGIDHVELTGYAVSSAGDFNGDGFDDFLLGAPAGVADSLDETGSVYLVYGSAEPVGVKLAYAGAVIAGEGHGDRFGSSVTTAGDVDNDGFDDILIGAPHYQTGGVEVGRAYLVYGRPDLPRSVSVTETGVSVLTGFQQDALAGSALAGDGDVNNDGFGDIVIGAPGANGGAGLSYVLYGSGTRFADGTLDEYADTILSGETAGEASGHSLALLSDFNGDGADEIAIGAPFYDNAGFASGRAYLVYGGSLAGGESSLAEHVVLSDIDAATRTGFAVANAGDVNDDGFGDWLIGSPGDQNDTGRVSLLYGRQEPLAGGLISLAANVVFYGEADVTEGLAGFSAAGAGDVNADGCADLIIGAPGDFTDTPGKAFFIFGGSDVPQSVCVKSERRGGMNLAASDAILAGHNPGDGFGFAVAFAGDIENKGRDAIVIGAPYYDNDHDTGAGIVFAGPDPNCVPSVIAEDASNCGNNIDEDCSGYDLSCFDVDNDGDGYTENSGDCVDVDTGTLPAHLTPATIKPVPDETYCDGVDENCSCFQFTGDAWTEMDFDVGIKSDGTLWRWYAESENYYPVPVDNSTDWQRVSSSTNGSAFAALRADGSLWLWGIGNFGQLGFGDTLDVQAPMQLGAETWRDISLGYWHTAGVKTDGTLWTWGRNGSGCLGIGTFSETVYPAPQQVGTDSDWIRVWAGENFTLAQKADGRLFAWGTNSPEGPVLGIGNYEPQAAPQEVATTYTDWDGLAVGYLHVVAHRSNGEIWTWGRGAEGQLGVDAPQSNVPLQMGTDSDWIEVGATNNGSFGIKESGTLYSWGSHGGCYGVNNLGRECDSEVPFYTLGFVGLPDKNWLFLRSGDDAVIAMDEERHLWWWPAFDGSTIAPVLLVGATTGCDVPYIDEAFNVGANCTGAPGSCGVPEGTTGKTVCKADHSGSECNLPPGEPTAEICNNLDDDCDGVVNNGLGIFLLNAADEQNAQNTFQDNALQFCDTGVLQP